MSLILSNGVLAILLIVLSPEQCKIEADRINNDIHYADVWAYCEVTK